MFRSLVIVAAAVVMAGPSAGFDLVKSRALGMGRTVLLSRPTATDLVNLPNPGLDSAGLLIETGYNRRFELADLDHLFVVGAQRYHNLTVAFGAAQFGRTDLFAEQLLKGLVTYHRRTWSLAGSLSAMQVQIGKGYGSLRAATVGVGASWSRPQFILSLVADNLTRPALVPGGLPFNRTYTLYSEFQGRGAYSITGRIRVENHQRPQFGLGQVIRLSHKSSFFWGLGTAPLEYGGGIEVAIPIGSVAYATSVHPVLGFSHTVSLTYRPSRKTRPEDDDF